MLKEKRQKVTETLLELGEIIHVRPLTHLSYPMALWDVTEKML